MVFEPKFTKVVSSTRKPIGSIQSVVEVKLPTTDAIISNVLSVGAKSVVVSNEVIGRDIIINGVVDFQAVYMGDNISAVDYSAEFRDKFVSQEDVEGELILSSNVIDITSTISGNGIKVVAIVEITIDTIVSNELSVLTAVEGDSVHIATNDITYSTFIGRANEKFDVSEEFELQGVTNVLMVTPLVSLYSVDPRDNYLIVSGRVGLDICVQTGNDINSITTEYRYKDFSCEVAYDGITTSSIIQSVINVVYNEVKVSTVVDNGVANLSIVLPVNYMGMLYTENKLTVVDDLFVESNYISVTCENFKSITCGMGLSFKDNISGTASILETAPFIDDILGVCASNVVIASSRVSEGKLTVEGVANSIVAYYTKDTNEVTTVQVESPFLVEKKVDYPSASVVAVSLENISARSKRGKEIEVSAELNVFVDLSAENEGCLITQVVLGDEKKQDDCALQIYVVKPNQTVWDIAKELSVSQELIMEQNESVSLPLKAGDKLVVYKTNLMKY